MATKKTTGTKPAGKTKSTAKKVVAKNVVKKAAPAKRVPVEKKSKPAAAEVAKTNAVKTEAQTAPVSAPPPPAPTAKKQPMADAHTRKCVGCGNPIFDHKANCVAVVATPAEVAATKEQLDARSSARVCRTFNNRTCIELRREKDGDKTLVVFLPLREEAFEIARTGAYDFDHMYKEIIGYPVERAAKLYTGYSQYLGASEDAMVELSRLITVSHKEKESAMAKKPGVATATRTTKKDAKVEEEKKSMKAVKSAAPKAEKKDKAPRESAADMFRALIMEGKLTDDQIFSAVKKKFGLEDKKRSYVAWYRNDLKKKGQKPPAPKGEKKAA